MKYLRYQGDFLANNDEAFRIQILQEADQPFPNAPDPTAPLGGDGGASLDFPADSPLTIQWNETTTKFSPIRSSIATLKIISPTDRQFLDLYHITPGQISLKVWADSPPGGDGGASLALFWTGNLDPEFYEEPYAFQDGYIVTLTFADFSILKRTPYQPVSSSVSAVNGALNLGALLNNLLTQTNLDFYVPTGQDFNFRYLISTAVGNPDALNLNPLNYAYYLQSNFADENQDYMTAWQALEAVLQPLALTITQRGGEIYIYDPNALHILANNPNPAGEQSSSGHAVYGDNNHVFSNLTTTFKNNLKHTVYWTSTDAALSIDKTFNNVTVTFSPYIQRNIAEITVEPGIVTNPDSIFGNPGTVIRSDDTADAVNDFLFRMQTKQHWNIEQNHKLFDTKPLFKDTKEAGIVYRIHLYNINPNGIVNYDDDHLLSLTAFPPLDPLQSPITLKARPSLLTLSSSAGAVNGDNGGASFFLKLQADLLIDKRYNPFEPASANNPQASEANRAYADCAFLAFQLRLKDLNTGETIYHYDNSNLVAISSNTPPANTDTGLWLEGDYPDSSQNSQTNIGDYITIHWHDRAMLSYYTAGAVHNEGWLANRQPFTLPQTRKALDTFRNSATQGELIPTPPVSGSLELTLYKNITYMAAAIIPNDTIHWGVLGPSDVLAQQFNFVLVNNIEFSILDNYLRDIQAFDLITKAEVEPDALEELNLTTFTGTLQEPHPTALGQIFFNNKPIITVARAGYADSLQKLLCGSVFSQYKGRKLCLSGTARHISPLAVFNDDASPDIDFMLAAEQLDVIKAQSKIKLIEISQDNYQGIEYSTETS